MAENFASRWSRLKISRADEAPAPTNDGAGLPDGAGAVTGVQDESGNLDCDELPEQVFDVTSLPSIDSITVETDIRAFLQTGVPEDLKRSALRRAWTTNPAIRDFIGIAENQWDFNDPNGLPGFGPLRDTDNVPMLVAQALGQFRNARASIDKVSASNAPSDETREVRASPLAKGDVKAGVEVLSPAVAVQQSPIQTEHDISFAERGQTGSGEQEEVRRRRSHGGALPR
ncbi:hypothetical protein V1291_003969 [Nitrobacteraceae bacterium AZCC 1564]